jgi:hypothetical protein
MDKREKQMMLVVVAERFSEVEKKRWREKPGPALLCGRAHLDEQASHGVEILSVYRTDSVIQLTFLI